VLKQERSVFRAGSAVNYASPALTPAHQIVDVDQNLLQRDTLLVQVTKLT
jgi:hypothetical protein